MKSRRLFICLFLSLFLSSCPMEEELPTPAPDAQISPILPERPLSVWNGKIKVASIFPTQGRYSNSGQQSHNGTAMAVEEINSQGGIHGRELEMLRYGTGSYYIDAGYAARLAVQDRAVALIGSNSSDLSLEMAKVAQENCIPMISNVSTLPNLTWDLSGTNYEYVFRVCQSDEVAGIQLALFAKEVLKARRVAVLYEVGRTYSLNLARTFISSFEQPGSGYETERFFYLEMAIDFQIQLEEIRRFEPDVLFIPGSFSDATLIAMQAKALGIQAILLGGDSWSNTLLFKRGGPLRPAFFYDHWFPEDPFLSKYEEGYGQIPNGGRAALAYDAVLAVAAALKGLGPLKDSGLLEGLPETRTRLMMGLKDVRIDGISGPISFDRHGDRQKGGVFVKVENGKQSRFPWPR